MRLLVDHCLLSAWLAAGYLVARWRHSAFLVDPAAAASSWAASASAAVQLALDSPASFHTAYLLACVYLLAAGAWLLGRAYVLFFEPLNWIGNFWDPLTGTDSRTRNEKNPGDMPPPFPNGWFRVCDSFEVEVGRALGDLVFSTRLAIFRGLDGCVGAVNEACPHCEGCLSKGKVTQDGIQCPGCFRVYSREGVCPEGEHLPRVRAWPTEEGNNHVYVWHHAEGKDPLWQPTLPAEIASGQFVYHGRTEHVLSAHVAEMPENGPDLAHFNFLHADFVIPQLSPLLKHHWDATWNPGKTESDRHCAFVVIDQYVQMFGKNLQSSKVHVEVTQNGLGLVCLKFFTPFGCIIAFESVTPIHPLLQKFHHCPWAEWRVPRIVAKGVLKALITQAGRDIPVWNHKTYMAKPVLVKGDGPIHTFRKWFRQFYSDANWAEVSDPAFAPRPAIRSFWLPKAASDADQL